MDPGDRTATALAGGHLEILTGRIDVGVPIGPQTGIDPRFFPVVRFEKALDLIPDIIISDPHQSTYTPSPKSLGLDAQWVADHMVGLDPTPRFTSTCLIALAQNSDRELLLDYTPAWGASHSNIVTYTAGWAGKYIPIMGDMIVRMLCEETESLTYGDFTIDLKNFAIDWPTSS